MITKVLLLVLLFQHSNPLKIGVNLPQNPKDKHLIAQAINDALNSTDNNSEYELFHLPTNQTCVNFILNIGRSIDQSDKNDRKVPRISVLDQYDELFSRNSENMIVFRSPSALLLRLIPEFVSRHQLRKIFIFHDASIESVNSTLAELFDSSDIKFGSMLMNFNNSDQLGKYLRKQKRIIDMGYFIVGQARSINLFLDLVQQNELFRASSRWFALTRSISKIKCSSCSHSTITLIRPIISNLHEYENPPKNAPPKCSENYFDYHFYYDLMTLALRAVGNLDLHDKSCEKSVQKYHHSISYVENFLTESEAYFGRFGEYHAEPRMALNDDQPFMASYQKVNYEVIELRKTFKKSEKSRKMYIQYEEPSPQIIKTSLLESDDDGDKINVVTLIQPPFVMKRTVNGSSDVEYYGFLVDIFDEMRRELGSEFPEYEIVEDESGLYGISNDALAKGVKDEIAWTGIAASFEEEDGENYFGLVAMTIAGSRDLIMDFSEPILDYVGIIALMRKPDYQDHFFVYATVLEKNVWLCILGAYLLTSVVIAIFDYYSPYSMRYVKDKIEDDDNEGDDRVFTLKESLWFCFTSLTPQGGGEGPRALSSRLVTATWWLFGFIVVASYTANLAAFLTVSRLDRNIQTFDDLTIQYKVRYSPVEGTATARHFEMLAMNEERFYEVWKDLSLNDSMTDEERARLAVWEYPVGDRFTKIWAQMNEIEKPTSFEGAIRRIRDSPSPREGFGLVGEAPSLQWIQMFSCDMIVVGPEFAFRPIAFPIKKGDPLGLKKKIDPILKKMKDDGRLNAYRLKYWDQSLMKRKCQDYRKLSDGITLRNSGGLFIIIGVCLFATSLTLPMENMIISFFMHFEMERNELKSHDTEKSRKKNFFHRTWVKWINWLKS